MSEQIYRRRLPHYHLEASAIFITYRTFDSLPKHVLRQLEREHQREREAIRQGIANESDRCGPYRMARSKNFLRLDRSLDSRYPGTIHLLEPWTADLIKGALLHYHPTRYRMVCFTLMPNHLHFICRVENPATILSDVIGNQKRYIATHYNRHFGRKGPLWHREYFDHVIREGNMGSTIRYILNNPVKAGLAPSWQAWPHTWLHSDYIQYAEE